MDVNQEFKFFGKLKEKKFFGGGVGSGGQWEGSGWGGGSGWM